MAQTNYPDRSVSEGDQFVTLSQSGPKCRRIFTVDDPSPLSDPTELLYDVITNGSWMPGDPSFDIPIRMTPHPTITYPTAWSDYYFGKGTFAASNAFCADVISAKNLDDKAIVEVEYAILNGETQEASTDGDKAPALLQMGASVHSQKFYTDYDGNTMLVPYVAAGGIGGTFTISDQLDNTVDPAKSLTGADVQVPGILFRFTRRETAPRSPKGWEGFVNSVAWTIAGISYDAGTILCTRIENVTRDGGLTYIVTYEFQWIDLQTLADAQYVSAGCVPSSGGVVSPWQHFGFYALPPGMTGSDGTHNIATNAIPSDAVASVFQMYGTVDFNDATTGLHLT